MLSTKTAYSAHKSMKNRGKISRRPPMRARLFPVCRGRFLFLLFRLYPIIRAGFIRLSAPVLFNFSSFSKGPFFNFSSFSGRSGAAALQEKGRRPLPDSIEPISPAAPLLFASIRKKTPEN
jgi:hypothetical protein